MARKRSKRSRITVPHWLSYVAPGLLLALGLGLAGWSAYSLATYTETTAAFTKRVWWSMRPPERRAVVRDTLLARKLPDLTPAALARWVELSEDLPFTALTQLVISVECLDHELEAAAQALRELDRSTPNSDQFGGAEAGEAKRMITRCLAIERRGGGGFASAQGL
jgi:hypothetical protein